MDALERSVTEVARRTDFSGVVRVDDEAGTRLALAYGLADRANSVDVTLDTRFAVASGTKGLTALTVMGLVERGELSLDTTARSVLGKDLPLVDDAVTVEQLLAHRSGIGDYLDEDTDLDIEDYLMPVPVHELTTTEDYLRVLDGHRAKFAPGERFSYCNSGYVVLALIAERRAGQPFPELVTSLVCEPAGLVDTDYLRSDQLPGRAALGYLQVDGHWRTNLLHLPVRGNGDGGIYSTVADVHRFWLALFDGRIVTLQTLAEMVRPRSTVPSGKYRYGLGFWLHGSSDVVQLDGYDVGVSFHSWYDPASGLTATVIANTAEGAGPVLELLQTIVFG